MTNFRNLYRIYIRKNDFADKHKTAHAGRGIRQVLVQARRLAHCSRE